MYIFALIFRIVKSVVAVDRFAIVARCVGTEPGMIMTHSIQDSPPAALTLARWSHVP